MSIIGHSARKPEARQYPKGKSYSKECSVLLEADVQVNILCAQGFEQLNHIPNMPSDEPQATPSHSFEVSKLTSSYHNHTSL